MEYFFRRFVTDNNQLIDNCTLSYDQFKKMMIDLEFDFESEQLEELYCFLDENNDFLITIQEFKNKIFESRIDIEKALRSIRRAIIESEFDIEEALKSKDVNKKGTVAYQVWAKLLKQHEVDIKPVELEAIFKYFSQNAEKELDYVYIFYMQSSVFDLFFIDNLSMRWSISNLISVTFKRKCLRCARSTRLNQINCLSYLTRRRMV